MSNYVQQMFSEQSDRDQHRKFVNQVVFSSVGALLIVSLVAYELRSLWLPLWSRYFE